MKIDPALERRLLSTPGAVLGPAAMVGDAPKRSKYGAVVTEVDGIRFASRKEAKRYGILKIMLAAGEIADLELQPEFPLIVNGVLVARYVADFRYRLGRKIVVEDVKSKATKTPVYRLKKKIVEALYDIEVIET